METSDGGRISPLVTGCRTHVVGQSCRKDNMVNFGPVRNAIVVISLASMSTIALITPASAAQDGPDAEHARVLANVVAALEKAPEELKVDEEVLSLLSTSALRAIPVRYLSVASMVPTASNPLASGCTTANGDYIYALNITDDKIWRWKATQHFCWDGDEVTSVNDPIIYHHIYAWADVAGWQYE